jgi:hypothetical protein
MTQAKKTIDVSAVLGVIGYCEDTPTETLLEKPFSFEADFLPQAQSSHHVHPNQDERYKILRGTLDLFVEDGWHKLGSGQSITIPKGTVHAFRNSTNETVRAINTHDPGLRFRESLEVMERLIQEGKVTGMNGPKNGIYLSLHTVEYEDLLVTARPHYRLVRLVARIGELLGYGIGPPSPNGGLEEPAAREDEHRLRFFGAPGDLVAVSVPAIFVTLVL